MEADVFRNEADVFRNEADVFRNQTDVVRFFSSCTLLTSNDKLLMGTLVFLGKFFEGFLKISVAYLSAVIGTLGEELVSVSNCEA